MRLEPPSTHRPSTRVAPRTIIVHGRVTSIRLEDDFWRWIREIAYEQKLTIRALIENVIASKPATWPLTSALRIAIARYWRNRNGRLFHVDLDHEARGRLPRAKITRRTSDGPRPPRPKA